MLFKIVQVKICAELLGEQILHPPTIMIAPFIGDQITDNDTIDLLRPTLNVHESHYERTFEIIMC